jgi:hypothetical protein
MKNKCPLKDPYIMVSEYTFNVDAVEEELII